MSVAELQKYTSVSKYARHIQELNRREVWPETVERWADGFATKYPGEAGRIRHLADRYVRPMDVLPSMRSLQFGGPPLLKHEARTYNCCSSNVDRLSFFGQAMYLLLAGSGVGYSVQERHIRHLPGFSKARLAGRKLPKKPYRVPDSIEGWASCAHVQLSSHFDRPVPGYEEYFDCEVEFEFDDVRPAGSPLSYGVGTAPGPKPLAQALARNKRLLARAIGEGHTRLTDEQASDYHLNGSDAVVSGGVRRSANLGVFDRDSPRMRAYKTGNWFEANPQRGRANMSAALPRGKVTWEEFFALFECTRQFGEPGFIWLDDLDFCYNPCVEIGMYPYLLVDEADSARLGRYFAAYDGPVDRAHTPGKVRLSGFQGCNLSSVNGKTVRDKDDFFERAEAAAEIGTWQAGMTKMPFVGPVSEDIFRAESLIGVSVCGMMHHPEIFLDPAALREGAARVVARNERVAARIGINPAARTTCVKPDGNLASLLGSYSGCHPGKIRRGFRTVQANRQEAPYRHFKSRNEAACEPSAWSREGTDDVIRFCVEYEGLLEDDMTAVEFLGHVRTVQNNWVRPGTVPARCVVPGLCHNTSNTVKVREHEWAEVAEQIFTHQADYAGVSLISQSGDKDYVQAPFTAVPTAEEMLARYGHPAVARASALLNALPAGDSVTLWQWCDMLLGLRGRTEQAAWWLDQVKDLAAALFASDVKLTSYCLKDVYCYYLHQRLKAEYVEVDYAGMVEERSGVNLGGEVACAGGACEV
jgi:ribonucleoside-diphosphate reductase alpha chain